MKKILFAFIFVLSVIKLSATDVYNGAIVDVVFYDRSGDFIYNCSFNDCTLYGFPNSLPFVAVPSMSSGDIHQLRITDFHFMEYCYKANTNHYDLPVLMKKAETIYSCYIRIMY